MMFFLFLRGEKHRRVSKVSLEEALLNFCNDSKRGEWCIANFMIYAIF